MLYRNFATQQEIDDQYDVERSVDDPKPYFELFVGDSAKARSELECLLDVPFGPTVEETVDIFPARDADAPILVFIHGRLLAPAVIKGILASCARSRRARDHRCHY